MFEIGWTEMLVIAVVMIVVVGPKDLPRMLRTFGRMTTKLRGMAGDFQKQFNDAIKEAELDDVKKSVESLRSLNPAHEIRKQLNPFEKAAADVRAGLDSALKPTPKPEALAETHPAEPLKAGGLEAGLPVAGPSAMPATPVFGAEPVAAVAAPAGKATAAEAAPVATTASTSGRARAPRRSASAGTTRTVTPELNGSAEAGRRFGEAANGSAQPANGAAATPNGLAEDRSAALTKPRRKTARSVATEAQPDTSARPSAGTAGASAPAQSPAPPPPRSGRKAAGPVT